MNTQDTLPEVLTKKPKATSGKAEKEIVNLEAQLADLQAQIKSLTMDKMALAPKQEREEQTKLSQKEIDKSRDIYLKPKTTLMAVDAKTGVGQKFNEAFRDEYNFKKEFVKFIAENHEIKGESITMWTRPFGGMPAEEWIVPVNIPVWGPRYLAEQLTRKSYHRLSMKDPSAQDFFDKKNQTTGGDSVSYYGQLAVDTTIQRLDARPVTDKKSIFMGSNG